MTLLFFTGDHGAPVINLAVVGSEQDSAPILPAVKKNSVTRSVIMVGIS